MELEITAQALRAELDMLREFSELERRFMEEQIAEQRVKGESYLNTIADLQHSNAVNSQQV